MKLSELQKFSNGKIECVVCKKGVAASRIPIFLRLVVNSAKLDAAAINRASGLEQLLGGHVALARAMGPDETIAVESEPQTCFVCASCLHTLPIGVLESVSAGIPAV